MNSRLFNNFFSPNIRLLLVFLILSAALICGLFSYFNTVHAASLDGFRAGRIIDDSVFTNNNSMNAQQIQQFLNSKVPVCDTWHSAAYGQNPPFTCLKDYSENSKSAAQIIYDTAQQYRINPQVLIVLLQKEQGLVTDTWPLNKQYRSATGYGCPDSTPGVCDGQYYGFTNQLIWASKMFRSIMDNNPNWYTPYILGNNYIRYDPDASCGGSNVNIENRATQALYNYTPYQPNSAALAAGYGSAEPCGAYGNRNFYLYFTDWFGGTSGPEFSWQYISQDAYIDSGRTQKFTSQTFIAPGQTVYLTVKARNNGRVAWEKSFLRLGTSHPQDRSSVFKDSTWPTDTRPAQLVEDAVAPSEVGTFLFSAKAPSLTGTYNEYFQPVAEARTWLNDLGLYFTINVTQPTNASNSTNTGLASGQSIEKGQYLLSPDTHTTLVVQQDGNLVQYANFGAMWHSGTGSSSGNVLTMQTDGNLVLYDKNNTAIWNSRTNGNPGAYLTLQTDGNIVIYSTSHTPLWSTGVINVPDHLRMTVSSIGTSTLYAGQYLETADRKYKFVLQADGNLVLYKQGNAIWASSTVGSGPTRLVLQADGNLVLYKQNNTAVWSSGSVGNGYSTLYMQADGNVVLYKAIGGTATWYTGTRG